MATITERRAHLRRQGVLEHSVFRTLPQRDVGIPGFLKGKGHSQLTELEPGCVPAGGEESFLWVCSPVHSW